MERPAVQGVDCKDPPQAHGAEAGRLQVAPVPAHLVSCGVWQQPLAHTLCASAGHGPGIRALTQSDTRCSV